VAVSHHDATLTSGNIEYYISGRDSVSDSYPRVIRYDMLLP
jgi:hypothetical protein